MRQVCTCRTCLRYVEEKYYRDKTVTCRKKSRVAGIPKSSPDCFVCSIDISVQVPSSTAKSLYLEVSCFYAIQAKFRLYRFWLCSHSIRSILHHPAQRLPRNIHCRNKSWGNRLPCPSTPEQPSIPACHVVCLDSPHRSTHTQSSEVRVSAPGQTPRLTLP